MASPIMPRASSEQLEVKAGVAEVRELRREYQLGKQLGVGRYGVVRACKSRASAWHTKLESSSLACKSIALRQNQAKGEDDDHMEEVEVLRSLQEHPNIVRFYDAILEIKSASSPSKRSVFPFRRPPADASCDYLHIIMQRCRGPSLKQLVTEKGKLSEVEAARIIRTVLDVLRHCHEVGIVHRDVKDTNFLFLTSDSTSPLIAIDFGLAVHKDKADNASDLAGSPYFIAPEVLHNCMATMKRRASYSSSDSHSQAVSEDSGRKDGSSDISSVRSDDSRDAGVVDPRSDVWSAGVLLYFLLSGRYPFDATNLGSLFRAITTAPLDLSSAAWQDVSPDCRDFVASLLCRDVLIRPSAADALQHRWIRKHCP